jgi:hypothetical protein
MRHRGAAASTSTIRVAVGEKIMSRLSVTLRGAPHLCTAIFILALIASWGSTSPALARNNIRDAFFDVYPGAIGTPIETVPSQVGHCGMCHYEFTGGGPRNPYGVLLETALPGFPSNPNGRRQAVQSIENDDPDGDGFTTLVEITDTITFSNTPTFPGLTPANVGGCTSVDIAEIQDYLVPSTGSDTTPPSVTVISPNGGETYTANLSTTIEWIAGDISGIAGIEIHLSLDNGVTWDTIAEGLSNSGTYTWFPANRPSTQAVIRVEATDNAFNEGDDASDAVFSIQSPPGGLAPTTLRDFDMPGSQPHDAGILNPPAACAVCHGDYDQAVEPYFNWRGSMMAQASRDPLWMAMQTISNQDAPDSGDLCLRCHVPRGWLQGRSVPTDGSAMLDSDKFGVSCDLCHRMLDPIYEPGASPIEDVDILDELAQVPSVFSNGQYVIDPTGARRGPFVDATSGHPILVSPFHREAALCGTCHDVSNPVFEKQPDGSYLPNTFDEAAGSLHSHAIGPVERTYSEWFYSDYNSPSGVYAPQFGGNLDYVGSCQDCHMRDITGQGCSLDPPVRDDLPWHDMTGGSTWLARVLPNLYPGEVDAIAMQAGADRALYMLQNAAELDAIQDGGELLVTVTNNTGHKLPTGYPEGRRMWLNIQFFDDQMTLLGESGAYDASTGVLTYDAAVKIYEVKPGMDENVAPLAGVDPGPSFHFVLNNKIFKDNRIPPRGFTNAAYDAFGGAPIAYTYVDGQYWDDTYYAIPAGAASVEVTLYYQSTTKEFVEFLRDENVTDNTGQLMYDLWDDNGKCAPSVMATASIDLVGGPACPWDTAPAGGDGTVGLGDLNGLLSNWGSCPAPPDDCPWDFAPAGGDGTVGLGDLNALLSNWGPCP